jgi:murein DD-endopeptidase MepM/ murein hydrolase activator NlpD
VNQNRLGWTFRRAALPERAEGAAGATPRPEIGLTSLPDDTSEKRDEMAWLSKFARDWISAHRIAPEHFPMEMLMLSTRGRLDRGASVANARATLEQDLENASLAFAPAGAKPTHGERYRFPFETAEARRVAANRVVHGYEKTYLHALDFEMPVGSTVLVARSGVVARVITGFAPGEAKNRGRTADPAHGDAVNRVVIVHADGTYATYFPLAAEVHVVEGTKVLAGDVLGKTARAGSSAPILHLDVRRNVQSSGKLMASPVRIAFDGVADQDGVPVMGRRYGGGDTQLPAAPDYRIH